MHLSRESEYGLKAMMYLAQQPPATVLTLHQIAEAEELPAGFLAKTFQKLVRHGLVQSFRGRQRGYRLAREASQISLRELLEAIEGPDLFQHCVFWSDRCADKKPCPLHRRWGLLKDRFVKLFEKTALEELAKRPRVRGMSRRP